VTDLKKKMPKSGVRMIPRQQMLAPRKRACTEVAAATREGVASREATEIVATVMKVVAAVATVTETEATETEAASEVVLLSQAAPRSPL
jgi:hypothetical protein